MPRKKITNEELELNKYIGNRIKQYRKLRKLKSSYCAKELNISINQYCLYEKGRGDIKISRLVKLSKILGIYIGELLPDNIDYSPLSSDTIDLLTYINDHNLEIKEIKDVIENLEWE